MTTIHSLPGKSPRILILLGAVAACMTGLAAYSSFTGSKAAVAELGNVTEVRELRVDTASGDLRFFDQRTGELVATLPTVTEGFVQVTMRNLNRLRTSAGHPAAAPYRLQRHAGGHIVLVDPETGTSVSLDAFGHSNAQAFARLLKGNAS